MKDDIDITVNAGKIAVMDKDKQKNIKVFYPLTK